VIDLHTHSTFSDGSLSPQALVHAAGEAGLSALALTDHDTTAGIPSFMRACKSAGITGVPGVEISVEFSPGTMHMLGFFMDLDHQPLQDALARLREGREQRNRKILAALCDLGMALTWGEVAALAGSDVIGRPHIAQAMINRGYASTKKEVFRRFLGRGLSAYVERFRLDPHKGIGLIRDAGGVCVLAHPFTLKLQKKKLRTCIAKLVASGLQGLEVFYPEHGPERRHQYQRLARAFDLVMTGGSDFHGDANPAIKLGRGFDNVYVSDAILDDLRERVGQVDKGSSKERRNDEN
jgi:3',5'-nucleoside bisphosphate phosphatase